MEHKELLKEIAKHFDDKTALMRGDIKDIDTKLDAYQERLVKVESTLGFIKAGFSVVMAAITGTISYLFYKYIDTFTLK